MAKIFKISGYLIDPNGMFCMENVRDDIEINGMFGQHLHVEEADIPEWKDVIDVNKTNCDLAECEKYFKEKVNFEDVYDERFNLIVPGSKWRHFKGKIIEIVDIAQSTEMPGSWYVIYKHSDTVWSRPLDMFLSEVDHEKYPDVEQKYRFEYIPPHKELILPWDEEEGTRKGILHKAEECVCGHREQDYGSPEDNFARIGKFWSTYTGKDISPADVANMMVLFKVARTMENGGTEDTYVDMAGYAACAGEIIANSRK